MELITEIADPDRSTLSSIVELYSRVWPEQDVASHLSKALWAFGGNPAGSAPLLISRDGDTGSIVGVRGGIVWPIVRRGEVVPAIQLHGTAVDASVRRMGVFSSLTQRFVDMAVEENVALIFNVSVADSKRAYQRLGWNYTSDFKRLVLPRRPFRILAHILGDSSSDDPRGERAYPVRSHDWIRPAYDSLRPLLLLRAKQMNELAHTDYVNREFFEWRFPAGHYGWSGSRERGYVVYRMRNRGGLSEMLIGDIWMPPRTNILGPLLLALRRENPDIATAWVTRWHPLYRKLQSAGFLGQPRHSLNLGCRTLVPNEEPLRWALMAADIDTF